MTIRIVNKASFDYCGSFSEAEKDIINKYLMELLNNVNRKRINIIKDGGQLVKVIDLINNKEITNFYTAEIQL